MHGARGDGCTSWVRCTDLVEVEDKVQLADVAEVRVQDLHEEVDGLEVGEVVVVDIDTEGEEETAVAAVNKLVVTVLDEVGVAGIAGSYNAMDLSLYLLLLGIIHMHVPLDKTGFTRAILKKDITQHC